MFSSRAAGAALQLSKARTLLGWTKARLEQMPVS